MGSERYTELIDAAQVQQDSTNKAALAAVQARMKLDNCDPDFDGKHCACGCGALVPKARRDLGYQRTVGCQEAIERKRSQRRK